MTENDFIKTLQEVEGKKYTTRRGFIIGKEYLHIGVIHDELFSWKEFLPILHKQDWRDYCAENKINIIRFDISGYCSAFEFFVKPTLDSIKMCSGIAKSIVTVAIHYSDSVEEANDVERRIERYVP